MIVKVTDEPKARTRRKTYHYIREGNILRHISEYALKETKSGDEKAWKITYDVPMGSIEGKEVYEFSFTNSGSFGVSKYPSSEICKEKDRRYESVSIAELQILEFEIENNEVSIFVEEIKEFYAPMITDVNNFKAKVGIDHILTSQRVMDYLKNIKYGLAACLCNWPEGARLKSLEQVSKLLHQLWTLKMLHEAVNVIKVERSWHTEQGSKFPASTFVDNKDRYWTCWFEPQKIQEAPPNYVGPLTPLFEDRIVWKRPDILISRGKYRTLVDAPKFDILIECKNLPFNYWWDDGKVVRNQLLPYKELFNPEIIIIASLKPIPDWAKDSLEKEGFIIVDKFYPGGKGTIEFKNIIGG